jgi:hypothetical protein
MTARKKRITFHLCRKRMYKKSRRDLSGYLSSGMEELP